MYEGLVRISVELCFIPLIVTSQLGEFLGQEVMYEVDCVIRWDSEPLADELA